jgi:hypothetical protein
MKRWVVKFIASNKSMSASTEISAPDKIQARIVAELLLGDSPIINIMEANDQQNSN